MIIVRKLEFANIDESYFKMLENLEIFEILKSCLIGITMREIIKWV